MFSAYSTWRSGYGSSCSTDGCGAAPSSSGGRHGDLDPAVGVVAEPVGEQEQGEERDRGHDFLPSHDNVGHP